MFILENGMTINTKGRERWNSAMELCTTDNGKIIKYKVMDLTKMKKVGYGKASSETTNSKAECKCTCQNKGRNKLEKNRSRLKQMSY